MGCYLSQQECGLIHMRLEHTNNIAMQKHFSIYGGSTPQQYSDAEEHKGSASLPMTRPLEVS
jgi:putative IMPACT (imprinted ancient) family translation regulator